MKRYPSEWETIIAKEATDKELSSKIYKQLMQIIIGKKKKKNNLIKKWEKDLNKHFFSPKEDTDG